MNEQLTNTVMTYLTTRRMSSLGNLAMHLGRPASELSPIVKTLKLNRRLRLATPRCGGTCDTCDRCETQTVEQILTAETILISLEKKADEL